MDALDPVPFAPVEYPPCAVCGETRVDVLCPADEIRAQLDWLRRFHLRRLKPGPSGAPPRAALEDRAEFTQSFVTNVVACAACGLVFRDPRPTEEAIAAAYAHDHYGEARLAALHDAQRELYDDKVRVLRHWLAPGPDVRVHELGSFVGGFLVAGARQGWTMRGIDPGEEVAAFCAARGLPVVRATIEDLDVPPATIDCVAIWNTFDQLPDPHATLAAVARVLRPGGILALRIPNGLAFRRTVARLRRASPILAPALRAALAWNNLLGFPYLFGYSAFTLERLLAPYGLQPLHVVPDTLVRLSDDATRAWAHIEERGLKLAWRAAWMAAGGRRAPALAPWLDVYFRAHVSRDFTVPLHALR